MNAVKVNNIIIVQLVRLAFMLCYTLVHNIEEYSHTGLQSKAHLHKLYIAPCICPENDVYSSIMTHKLLCMLVLQVLCHEYRVQ